MNEIHEIRYWHRQRCFAMEQRKRAVLALGSFLRLMLGWSKDKPEAERKLIASRAAAMIAGEDQGEWADVIAASEKARAPFEDIEKNCERRMKALATQLPVWDAFGAAVRGFGEVSLAVIVAEAGDLSGYATESKLWKRMGLAPAQNRVAPNLSREDRAEAWIANGYSPRRRSRMWNIGDALIKGNRDGIYRTIYLARKAYELERAPDMTKMHAHRRAQRYMEKRLLRDLLRAWRRPSALMAERPRNIVAAAFREAAAHQALGR